jgi:hypothetical protein
MAILQCSRKTPGFPLVVPPRGGFELDLMRGISSIPIDQSNEYVLYDQSGIMMD